MCMRRRHPNLAQHSSSCSCSSTGSDLAPNSWTGVRCLCPVGTFMKVARQFIAWYRCETGNRPVGYGMIGSDRRATIRTINQPGGRDQTVPYGTDSRLDAFPGNKLPGYHHKSLRDNKPSVPVHIFDSTSAARNGALEFWPSRIATLSVAGWSLGVMKASY
jgi:hypothetical protein